MIFSNLRRKCYLLNLVIFGRILHIGYFIYDRYIVFINSGLTHRLWTLVHIKEIPSCCHIDSFLLLIISTPLNLSCTVVFLFDVAETSRAILSGLFRLLIQQNDFMVQFNFVVSLCSNARYYFFVYRHVCVTLHCLQSKY